jgi:hypothetical protein
LLRTALKISPPREAEHTPMPSSRRQAITAASDDVVALRAPRCAACGCA